MSSLSRERNPEQFELLNCIFQTSLPAHPISSFSKYVNQKIMNSQHKNLASESVLICDRNL